MLCALCHKSEKLNNLHIIPEFFYKHLYDEEHRFSAIPLSKEQREYYLQKGLRDSLFCAECETLISKYENYVSKVFYGGTEIKVKNDNPIQLSGISYEKFKIFQLSILFRASVSNLDFLIM